jgi:hypothetical protein
LILQVDDLLFIAAAYRLDQNSRQPGAAAQSLRTASTFAKSETQRSAIAPGGRFFETNPFFR